MSAIVLRSSSCESPINAKVLSDAFNMYSLPSLAATTVNEQISMPPNNSETFKKEKKSRKCYERLSIDFLAVSVVCCVFTLVVP
jgi:hypothetical protein